jgi:hypothetical protein
MKVRHAARKGRQLLGLLIFFTGTVVLMDMLVGTVGQI